MTDEELSLMQDVVWDALRCVGSGLPYFVDRDDLAQEMRLAILEALPRFDAKKGTLRRFMFDRAKGGAYDSLRRSDWLSRNARRKACRASEVEHILSQHLGREPSSQEIGDAMGTTEDVRELAQKAMPMLSLELLEETYPHARSYQEPVQEEHVYSRQIRGAIMDVFSSIRPRTASMLTSRYLEGKDLRTAGHEIGVTESRVCQLLTESLPVLRSRMRWIRSQWF